MSMYSLAGISQLVAGEWKIQSYNRVLGSPILCLESPSMQDFLYWWMCEREMFCFKSCMRKDAFMWCVKGVFFFFLLDTIAILSFTMSSKLVLVFITYCVSQKEWVQGNQQPYLKMCPLYLQFYIWFSMSTTLGSLCKNINQSFEDEALNMDTNETRNLELLLDVADFAKFLAIV